MYPDADEILILADCGGTYGGSVFRLVSGNIPPEKATLIFPSGTISTPTPTYTWNAVAAASYYYLWVNDLPGWPSRFAQ
jgi:hypothetical protein